MLTLNCVVVGEGRPFSVDVASSATVGHLKRSIRMARRYKFGAEAIDLFLAFKNDAWLDATSANAMTLSDCRNDLPLMDPTVSIQQLGVLGSDFGRNDGDVHVLATLPPGGLNTAAFCPRVSVLEHLQSNRLPDGVEFFQALEQPLGFKIPVTMATTVAKWPDVFSFGDALYGSAVCFLLQHPNLGSSEVDITLTDSLWLHLFNRACGCRLYRDQSDPSSSHAVPRRDVVIVNGSVMVGKCVAISDQVAMNAAKMDLATTLWPDAYRTFPRGLTSIPVWTTCPARIELHQLTFDSSNEVFTAKLLTTYSVRDDNECVRFIVDLFKIMKWVFAIRMPNVLMHLFPGMRTKTPQGHYVTWAKAGLVKAYRADTAEIDLDLIQRIYDAKLTHVERGQRSGNTVTIAPVGQTLRKCLLETDLPRTVILKQVRAALDELHSIGVAHCDVRADNVFVLEDKLVILGSLEDCRPKDDPPPYQPEDKQCKTALKFEEYQFGKFEDELDEICYM